MTKGHILFDTSFEGLFDWFLTDLSFHIENFSISLFTFRFMFVPGRKKRSPFSFVLYEVQNPNNCVVVLFDDICTMFHIHSQWRNSCASYLRNHSNL